MYSFSRSSVVAKSRLELPFTYTSQKNCSRRLAALAATWQGALRSGPSRLRYGSLVSLPRAPTLDYALPAVRSPGGRQEGRAGQLFEKLPEASQVPCELLHTLVQLLVLSRQFH